MTLESRAVRSWLSGTSAHDVPQDAPSFNPIPGLVIAVTGLAMSAHRQETQFLVDIHFLWGTLLALFAAMRWITYLLLWVKSKTGRAIATSEPSRPPSEVLASFCLSCGGIAFILSMEPIGVEAIRAGHGTFVSSLTFVMRSSNVYHRRCDGFHDLRRIFDLLLLPLDGHGHGIQRFCQDARSRRHCDSPSPVYTSRVPVALGVLYARATFQTRIQPSRPASPRRTTLPLRRATTHC